MVVVDESERITAANRLAQRLMSATQEALVGSSLTSFVDAEHRPRFREALRARGRPRDVLLHFRVCAEPTTIAMAMASVDDAGSGLDTLIAMRTATSTEVVTDDRHEASKMEALGRLVGGLAHDFNSALSGIAGCADVALRHIEATRPEREYVQEIKDAAMRASTMSRKLLDFGRRPAVAMTVFDLGELLRSLDAELLRLAGDHINLRITTSRVPSWVRGDQRQIARVILDLVANARDAIEEEGHIEIDTALETITRASEGRRRFLPPGSYVRLTVTDGGSGMSRETLERAFEPFFSTRAASEGAGLGLALVASTVEGAGGHVEVTSSEGEGTSVDVYLPEILGPDPTVDSVAELGGEETILVIEDDRLVRRTLCDNLQHRGYRVLDADSGPTAIQRSQAFAGVIDLVLTDMILPGMGGPEVVRAIRAQRPGVRAVFMSASFRAETTVRASRLGSDRNFIAKPFEEEHLAALLRRVLEVV